MKNIVFIISLFIGFITNSQVVTIYTEDFSNDWKKGAITYGGITPAQPTDGNWSWTNVGSPDNDGGSASSWDDMAFIDGAAVMSTNGATSSTLAFRWNDVNNGSTANRVDWYTKTITGAYTTITASLNYAIGNGSSANSVWVYYQIDGGTWTLFGSSVNQSTASGTFTSSTLSCNSSIKLKVEALTRDYNSSYVTIDNVQITGCAVVVPSVSISATSTTICSNSSVTFTATPTNGGSSPTYQWKKNGTNVGTNSLTYTNSSLTNGDIITCVMTSNAACASPTTATSNTITMTVNSNVTPSVSISGISRISTGTSTTFTATPTNGGPSPTYQWKLNGNNVGTNSTTYTNSTLVNNDVITCIMTSNNTCQTTSTTTSNTITMTVDQLSIGGTVTGDQVVLYGGNASTITLTGNNGSVIKWQYAYNSDFSTTTDVANITTSVSGVSMGAMTQTVYYRAVVQNGVSPTANSSYATITVQNGLPIKLIYFRGLHNKIGNVIEWETATEDDNDYFTIYRSSYPIEWENIVRIDGGGNSNINHYYTFTDIGDFDGVFYYMLRQTDFNGKFIEYDPISINCNTVKLELIKITNVLGQDMDIDTPGLKIFHYSDGSKVIHRE